MNWTISQFPELEHLEPEERRQVLKGVPWGTYPSLLLRSIFPGLLVAWPLATIIGSGGAGEVALWIFAIMSVTLSALLYLYQLRRLRNDMRKTLIAAFQTQRAHFCLGCGYDLRGAMATANACPECGAPITIAAARGN